MGHLNNIPPLQGGVPPHRWDGYDFGPGPKVTERLNQGPFGIDQDEGWYTIKATTPLDEPLKNFGYGLIGYTWDCGSSLAVKKGTQSLEEHVEKLASLPFVDVFYIRCDWKEIQQKPGKLELPPIWELTFDAAKRYNLRVGFRVQMSNVTGCLAIPDFLADKVPLVKIGRYKGQGHELIEPRYDHPEFQKAFRELNELLADRFDNNPLMEFVDLMMYGFWGEGHTSNLPNPIPDYLTAERTFLDMTQFQIETWKIVPLVVNMQPDISKAGNDAVQDLAVRSGCWLRSDSVILDEPIQIEALANRPPWLAVIMEDGYYRFYEVEEKAKPIVDAGLSFLDEAGINFLENCMEHVLDLGGNYWSLWHEADNLIKYHERYPKGFTKLQQRIGYRVRPSWIWQRKRYGTDELVIAFANNGVAGIPGVLRVYVESLDGKVRVGGSLDAGHPYGGRIRLASFILPPGMDGQKFKIRGEIETKGGVRRPIRWACAQPLNPDGSLTIQLKRHDDSNWRKGI